MGCTKHVNIIEECAELLATFHGTGHLLKCPVYPNGKQQRHEWVPLFATLSLCDEPLSAISVHPRTSGRGAARQSNEGYHGLGCGHAQESLEHCGPQHVVVCANPVHAQDRRLGIRVCGSSQKTNRSEYVQRLNPHFELSSNDGADHAIQEHARERQHQSPHDEGKKHAREACHHRCPPLLTAWSILETRSARLPISSNVALVRDDKLPRPAVRGTRTALHD